MWGVSKKKEVNNVGGVDKIFPFSPAPQDLKINGVTLKCPLGNMYEMIRFSF